MIVTLPTVIVDADPARLAGSAALLLELGADVVGRHTELVEAADWFADPGTAPQLLVVNVDPDPQGILEQVARILQMAPDTAVWVTSRLADPHVLMEAMHLGVREFIAMPAERERLERAMGKLARTRREHAKPAKLVVFVPTTGGCGATTAACNVAVALAKKGRAALIDLDLAGGAVAEALDLRPRFTLAHLTGSQIDANLVANALCVHEASGLQVLARPEMPEDAQKVDAAALSRILSAMAEMFDYIVVDASLSADPVYTAALRAADEIVLVVQLSVPSVRNAGRYLQALRRLGIHVGTAAQPGRVRIVVNRMIKRGSEVSPEAAERALGLKLTWSIPNDFRNTMSAINYGEPVVLRTPRAEISTSLVGLAHLLNGRAAETATPPPVTAGA